MTLDNNFESIFEQLASSDAEESESIHLPIIAVPSPIPIAPAVVEYNRFDMSPMAFELFERIRTSPLQMRPELIPHELLQAACRQRIADMRRHNRFDHFIPDCFSPNDLVRYLGFPLPTHYARGPRANNIESAGGNTISVDDQEEGWLRSPSHFAHVYGRTAFYAEQKYIGLEHLFEDGMSDVDALWVWISCPAAFDSPEPLYDWMAI